MRLSMSFRRLWAISPGPFHQLQGNRLREISIMDAIKGYDEDVPVRERTCLLFARVALGGGCPIVAGSIIWPLEVIVKGG